MTKTFNDLPWLAKVLLHIFFGWFGSGIYRNVTNLRIYKENNL